MNNAMHFDTNSSSNALFQFYFFFLFEKQLIEITTNEEQFKAETAKQ